MKIKYKCLSKMLSITTLFTIMLFAGLPASASAADRALSIGALGLAGPDLTASIKYVEYEQAIVDKLSFSLRGGFLGYDYDDDVYEEDGDGPGIEAGIRFYPSGNPLKGFFIGAGLGIWQTKWDWTDDKGTAWESKGSGDSTSAELHFTLGGRVGNKVQFMPTLQLGSFLSTDAELGAYAVLGASISFEL